jgi:hypothetical protein
MLAGTNQLDPITGRLAGVPTGKESISAVDFLFLEIFMFGVRLQP